MLQASRGIDLEAVRMIDQRGGQGRGRKQRRDCDDEGLAHRVGLALSALK
jgi:hypothetical protein